MQGCPGGQTGSQGRAKPCERSGWRCSALGDRDRRSGGDRRLLMPSAGCCRPEERAWPNAVAAWPSHSARFVGRNTCKRLCKRRRSVVPASRPKPQPSNRLTASSPPLRQPLAPSCKHQGHQSKMQAAQRAVSGAAAVPAPARRPAAAGAAAFGWRAGATRLPVVGSLSRRELLGSGAAAAALLPPLAAQASGAAPAAAAAAAPSAAPSADVQLRPLQLETDANGIQRLALQPEGGCWER